VRRRRLLRHVGTAAAIVVLGTGCAYDVTGEPNGLGSAAAAIACSDHVFWGTVEGTAVKADGLHITFQVDDWVRPASGDSRITLIADDPAENVGAPDWTTSERVLVMDGTDSPLDLLQGEVAEEMVAEWEQADATESCPDDY
jgi:hypothetical protein